MAYANIEVESHDKVGLIRLNRPNALNALNSALIDELGAALDGFERDNNIGCVIITGSPKAFAAGADIKEMQAKTYAEAYLGDFIASWERVSRTAKFGQPEIKLGVMPGVGGTQRLTRFVGKAKAMDMCLTGRMMDAAEAERSGLVTRVVPADQLIEEALKMANTIASMSRPVVMMTKESINRAYETTLAEGIRFERRVFHSMFALQDQKEGMTAFVEKRPPNFKHR
jgi:enoyl-CoA hydratase